MMKDSIFHYSKSHQNLISILLLFLLGILLFGFTPFSHAQAPQGTVVEVARDAGNFDTLVSLIQQAELVDALSDPSASFTVFAPTDEVFEALPSSVVETLQSDVDELRRILLYHVSGDGAQRSTDLEDGESIPTLLANRSLTISIGSDGSVSVNEATVEQADIEASNGVIHAINQVLIPPVLPRDDLSIFSEALVAANINVSSLSESNEDRFQYTVLAPNNEAFRKLPSVVIDTLLDPNNQELLREVLFYHIGQPAVVSSEVVLGQPETELNTIQGGTITLQRRERESESERESGSLSINQNDPNSVIEINNGEAIIVDVDNFDAIGVFHIIDEVLIPSLRLAELLRVYGFSTLADLIVAADLDASLPNLINNGEVFTVFAPTNEAIDRIPSEVVEELLANPERLRTVLLYHLYPNIRLPTSDFDNNRIIQSASSPNENGEDNEEGESGGLLSRLNVYENQPENENMTTVYTINGIRVVLPFGNIPLNGSLGILHAIDGVLMPVPQDIASVIETQDRFSALNDALNATGLLDSLRGDWESENVFTVFAPTNDALAQIPADIDRETLTQVLLYHVVPQVYFGAGLFDGQILNTLLEDRRISVAIMDQEDNNNNNSNNTNNNNNSSLRITLNNETVLVLETDITAQNGVIHIIDTVLNPQDSPPIDDDQDPEEDSIICRDSSNGYIIIESGADCPSNEEGGNNDDQRSSYRRAEINGENFVSAIQFTVECLGAPSTVNIESWNGDSFESTCIALYTGPPSPTGNEGSQNAAISVIPCDNEEPTLCQRQSDQNDENENNN